MRSEKAFVRFLQALFPAGEGEIGIGDDAAVVGGFGKRLVLTKDIVAEGTHFRWDWFSPRDLAWKALTPNVMDMIAMNALGRYLLIGVGTGKSARWLKSFYHETALAAGHYNLRVAGGDLVRSRQSFVAVTLVGTLRARSPLLRGRARIGEAIWLSGPLGEAEAGRRLLARAKRGRSRKAFLSPRADVDRLYRLLDLGLPTSAVDVSDGLLRDVRRLTGEGRLGACLDLSLLPSKPEVGLAARRLGTTAEELQVNSGEEPQILFTVPSGKRKTGALKHLGAVPIGVVVRRGLWLKEPGTGRAKRVPAKGYDHLERGEGGP